MRYALAVYSLLLLHGLSSLPAQEPVSSNLLIPDEEVSVSIIYDNYPCNQNLETDWGFACLVEYQGYRLLFDAGRRAELYKKNSGLLGVNPEEVSSLFISHEHGDHTAGIPWITEINPSVKCFLPASYAEQLKASGTLPPNCNAVKRPGHLYGPFYSTGDDFSAFREQGLVVNSENGGVLITGCGHPGIVSMIAVVEKELDIQIHAVIGGLHLMNTSKGDMELIAENLKELGIRQICPTHCTGDKSIAALQAIFGEDCIMGGAGKTIVIQ